MQRDQQFQKLKEQFDVLVIGGGITGLGVALEAQSRGLKTALIEYGDFAGETSCKSTKLIHGGLRYLQQAFSKLSFSNFYENINLVKEALLERAFLVQSTPQLTKSIPFIYTTQTLFESLYVYSGNMLYYYIAKFQMWKHGFNGQLWPMPTVYSKSQIEEIFPSLKGSPYKYGVSLQDGQMDDARQALIVAKKATQYGAVTINYCKLQRFKHNSSGKVIGAVVSDILTGKDYQVNSKVVINCTGPFSDKIRFLAQDNVNPKIKVAQGTHLALNGNLVERAALFGSSDGRLMFVIPWLGSCILGATDIPAQLGHNPSPQYSEVDFIIKEMSAALNISTHVLYKNLQAKFAGQRPLVMPDPNMNTKDIPRVHVIEQLQPSGLVSVMGGKWTIFRLMAEDTVDKVGYQFPNLKISKTIHLKLQEPINSEYYRYGQNNIQQMIEQNPQLKEEIIPGVNKAEVLFSMTNEWTYRTADFLIRRTRIGHTNQNILNEKNIRELINFMGLHYNWDSQRKEFEFCNVVHQLGQF